MALYTAQATHFSARTPAAKGSDSIPPPSSPKVARMSHWPRFFRLCSVVGVSLTVILSSHIARAEDYLALEPMTGKQIAIDGMLREWPGGFAQLKGDSGSAGSSALVGYDESFLYFAAKIKDKNIVRTAGGGQGEDRLQLSLYIPAVGARGTTHSIVLYPGVPGKIAALVKVDGQTVSGAEAVENPTADGFLLEAKVPISSLKALKNVRVGLRGVLSYHDASAVGRVRAVERSGKGEGAAMPALTTEPETGLIQALLQPKGLKFKPDREVYGDLAGNSGAECVALHGHFLSIVGPGYKDGKQFYYNELDVESAKQVTHLSLTDFDGDNKDEIVIQKRLGNETKYREVIQVLKIGRDGVPVQVFGHEIAIVTEAGSIVNKLTLTGRGKSARIKIEQGKVKGFDPSNYAEPIIGGSYKSALMPWEAAKSRSFGWEGTAIGQLDEQTWQPKMSAPLARSSSAAHTPTSSSAGSGMTAPPPPRAPNADEMLDRVYALYKQDRGVSRGSKPSFDFVTDVVDDTQMERVLVHDRDLVVFGKGFKKGLSYTYLTIGVKEAGDILSVTSRDVVGDGKAEIIVHAILNAQASKSLGGDIVGRQALFIYKVEGETLKRIFAAETGRSLNENRVLGAVAFLPAGKGLSIELRPLRAIGWTEKNYPFPEDLHPAGGLEPLPLPWGRLGSQRYVFNGNEYVKN